MVDAMKTTKPEPDWLSQKLMAKGCGVSLTAFEKWGVPPIAKIGRYTYYRVEDVVANRMDRALQRRQNDPPPSDLDRESLDRTEREEKLALVREQRIGQALKNAQLQKDLAPVALIEWTLGKLGGEISAVLESIPLKVKKVLPKLTSTEVELIKREVVKAQNAAARATVDLDEYYDRVPTGD